MPKPPLKVADGFVFVLKGPPSSEANEEKEFASIGYRKTVGVLAYENKLHWSLDVSFRENACRIGKGHVSENFRRLRCLALNLLKKPSHVAKTALFRAIGLDYPRPFCPATDTLDADYPSIVPTKIRLAIVLD